MSGALREGLLAQGTVRLFGREYTGLELKDLGLSPHATTPLAAALRDFAGDATKSPRLARIYAVAYKGGYERLPEPAVLLVFGPGIPVPSGAGPVDFDVAGAESTDGAFTDGVMMWNLDHLDMTVRIDVRMGSVRDLVLADVAAAAKGADGASRDAMLVGRDAMLVGRDAMLIGKGR